MYVRINFNLLDNNNTFTAHKKQTKQKSTIQISHIITAPFKLWTVYAKVYVI